MRDILAERQEQPDIDALLTGEIRILAKIGFADGEITLRRTSDTKTNMILVRPGDLVVSGINAAKGAIGYYSLAKTEPIAATIHYGSFTPNENRVDPKYLWLYMRSAEFPSLLARELPQGIKTELKASRLLPLRIPLPPLPEQQRIVATLERFSRFYGQATESQSVRGDLVNRLMESHLRYWMSQGWNLGHLHEVTVFPPRSGPAFETRRDWTGTRVLMPSAVTGFGLDISKYECGIGEEVINSKDRLQAGDIIIARGNKRDQVGNAGVVPEEAAGWVCANLLMRMQIDTSRVDRHFFIYWLRTPFMREHVRRNMSGTSPSIQKINQRVILNYPFPTSLSVTRQVEIANALDAVQAKVDQLQGLCQETVAATVALKGSVMDKAFRGEL
jgi:type I restriction enzyme S subunit